MAYLGNNLQVANSIYRVIDDISSGFNGSTTSFALTVQGLTPVPFPINEQNCLISVGGVPQKPDYTGAEGFKFSGSNIVFSSAPAAGEKFWGVILAGADYVAAGVTYPNGTANTPSITFGSNTSTGLFLSSTNVLGIATGGVQAVTVDSAQRVGIGTTTPGGALEVNAAASTAPAIFKINTSEAARIDGSGRLLVGTSSARSNFYNSSVTPDYQFETANQPRFSIVSSNSSADFGGQLILAHQKSGAVGGNTTLASGDYAGLLSFQGSDGSEFVETARIESIVDGTPGANDMPGRLVFSTTADGASSPTERLRIANNGAWGLAGANYGSSSQVLTSNGSGSAPTWQAAPSPAALSTASGSAPSYSARAWVNFDGTTASPSTIRGSGNVSSVTKNGTGRYTVNFTTSLPDTNYTMIGTHNVLDSYRGGIVQFVQAAYNTSALGGLSQLTGSCAMQTVVNNAGSAPGDAATVVVTFLR